MLHSMILHYHQMVKNTNLSLFICTFNVGGKIDIGYIDKNHIQKHPWNLNE